MKATKPTRNISGSPDPAKAYAQAVGAGLIVAGPYVRAACKRHLADLERVGSKDFPFYFDKAEAKRALGFFPDILTVEDSELGVAPFKPLDWALFVIAMLFGWRRQGSGFRRFRKAYVESGKGSGKTPLAAGIGLYMLLADQEFAAEVYAAAAKRDQAMILFGDMVKMVDRSPRLRTKLVKSGRNPVWQLTHRATTSIAKPLSADKKKSGMRVSCGLVDELHEHQDRYTIDMLEDGFKGRKQPLLFVITNSGFDRNSICWEWHEHAVAVVEGLRVDEEFFGYVMALDPEDDPLEDEACWPKTNPGIGKTITVEYLRSAVNGARAIPGRENQVRRLNFCEWTDADQGWMTRAAWVACERDLVEMVRPVKDRTGGAALPGAFGPDGDFKAECFLGLDLAFAFDLAALAFVFPEQIPDPAAPGGVLLGPDGHPVVRLAGWLEYFTPKDTARQRETTDRVPYLKWIDQGLIHGVPGQIIRKEHIAARIAEASGQFDIQWAAFDKYRHKELADEMVELGVSVPWIEHPQGFRRGGQLPPPLVGLDGKPLDNPLWMPDSVSKLETRILEKTIEVQSSEVTRWQVSSVVIRPNPAGTGDRVFDKAKAVGRIDGIVALAMAVGAAEMRLPRRSLKGFLSNPVMTR